MIEVSNIVRSARGQAKATVHQRTKKNWYEEGSVVFGHYWLFPTAHGTVRADRMDWRACLDTDSAKRPAPCIKFQWDQRSFVKRFFSPPLDFDGHWKPVTATHPHAHYHMLRHRVLPVTGLRKNDMATATSDVVPNVRPIIGASASPHFLLTVSPPET
jgi:hypothetical protein